MKENGYGVGERSIHSLLPPPTPDLVVSLALASKNKEEYSKM